ncbi:MAG: HAD family phosphatase [Pseudomonadota bacterium]
MRPRAVVFDVGRVLIAWDPRALFSQVLPDEAAVETFLTEICPPAWNAAQDRGRPWAEAVAEAVARHPDWAEEIRAWDTRWIETVPHEISGTVRLFERLEASGVPLYGLTNFSAEKWPLAVARYPVLGRFREVVISGDVRLIKPDPEIYRLLLDRIGLPAEACFFTDDSPTNIAAAAELGFDDHRFESPEGLERALTRRGLL